jgi:multidrug transporter EmrE-like cation transporter
LYSGNRNAGSFSVTLLQGSLLGLFAIILSIGQILFKQASGALAGGSGPGGVLSLVSSAHFWAAICLYGISTLLWIWLIKDIPLNRAYPFVALAFVLVPVLSRFVLDEELSRAGIAGSAVIVVGIVLSQA